MRYFMRLAYNGAPFCGWQRQPNAPSVQQTIEQALHTVLRVPVPITGAGRTDTGVHAACMFAHFDTQNPIPDTQALLRSVDRLCGRYIAIYEIFPVADEAHARFDATSRTYKYYVSNTKSPFLYPLSWQLSTSLDYDKMNCAARQLLEVDDFTSFAKLHSDAKTNICKVTEAQWTKEGALHVFTITADRFLRNMVRAIVGTLIEVGRGKMTEEQFRAVIQAQDRCAAGTSAPPHALFLHNVTYPYI